MRLTSPRIAPLPDGAISDDTVLRPLAEQGQLFNIFRTFGRRPEALRGFLEWGRHILSDDNRLPPREREIVILRVGFLCRSGYEFAQHEVLGLQSGLTRENIEQIKSGLGAAWSPAEAALIQMADELVGDHFVSDAVWAELRAHYDEETCMDAVFTAGQYVQVCCFLNTFGVQLDPGLTLDPDLEGPR